MSQKEARNEKLHRSFELIEDEFIVEASPRNAKPMVAIRRRIIKKVALIAACACLCVAAIPLFFLFGKDEPPQIPVYDDAQYSALDIGNLFLGTYDSVATNAYHEIHVPSEELLVTTIGQIPDEEYLTTYEKVTERHVLDEKVFSNFIDTILPKACAAVSEENPNKRHEAYSMALWKGEAYDFRVEQDAEATEFVLYSNDFKNTIVLGNTSLQIDISMTDDEIKETLKAIEKDLFDIFGADFNDIHIVRGYYDYGYEYGISSINVFFYNANDHKLNNYFYNVSDYIYISFDDHGEQGGGEKLFCHHICYEKKRKPAIENYVPTKEVKMISLEDAEALLRRGYVFGGHVCSLCMAMQDPIDFENYDYVGFEYIQGGINSNKVLPFYAFYKYIGDTQNGNKTYAKTYVPAIKVSGYEEYFESQAQYHKQSTGTEPQNT